jgi:DNA helicase-2/ATP-dependent DNA helicase PcrA
LEEFDSLLQEFEEDQFGTLNDEEKEALKPDLIARFLEQSALASEGDRDQANLASVNMMSLHSSKGLEFPVAFLVGMEDGLFPSVRPWEESDESEIEEERRLCYVGMTRAREYLYLTHVVVRRLWGNITYQEPARFFDEIPSDAIEFKDFAQGSAQSRYRASSQESAYGAAGSWEQKSASSSWGGRELPRSSLRRGADSDFSQLNPFENDTADDSNAPAVGKKLNHPDYGRGTLLQLEGSGDALRVTIEFSGRDRRKFLWRFVKDYLEKR